MWLAREFRHAAAAVTRDIGPAHKCQELNVFKLFSVDLRCLEGLQGIPLVPRNYFTLASPFVLREVEASLMLAKSVTIDAAALRVTILLPASKAGPKAFSCSRSWGCVCGGTRSRPCPVHAALDHIEVLKANFEVEGILPDDLHFP